MGLANPMGVSRSVESSGNDSKWPGWGLKILIRFPERGSSTPESINYLFFQLIPKFHEIEFVPHAHHSTKWHEKVDAAYKAVLFRS